MVIYTQPCETLPCKSKFKEVTNNNYLNIKLQSHKTLEHYNDNSLGFPTNETYFFHRWFPPLLSPSGLGFFLNPS